MARKSYEERLKELDEQLEQIRAKKQQVESRLKEKERKERTRRLIQVGAIFESNFGFEAKNPLTQEKAEQIALGLSKYVKENKEKFLKIDVEESKKQGEIIYKEEEEHIFTPDENKDNPYKS